MQECVRSDVSDGVSWYCPQCYTRKSIRDGSFFSKSKITLQKRMLLLHFWVRQCPVTDAMKDAEVDKHTAIDVFQGRYTVIITSVVHNNSLSNSPTPCLRSVRREMQCANAYKIPRFYENNAHVVPMAQVAMQATVMLTYAKMATMARVN